MLIGILPHVAVLERWNHFLSTVVRVIISVEACAEKYGAGQRIGYQGYVYCMITDEQPKSFASKLVSAQQKLLLAG